MIALSRFVQICAALIILGALGACSRNPMEPSSGLTVASITPSSGTTFGGTAVTVIGSNFTNGASVTIGGSSATDVVVVSPTTITAITGPHGQGGADVVISVGSKTARLAGGFTYVSPASTPNTPPVIASLIAQGARSRQPASFADLNEQIDVEVIVQDAETAAAALTYEWSAASGTFSGSGPRVRWRAPQVFTTPGSVLLSVVVVEPYTEPDASGLPVRREHRVSGGITVGVHDSVREVGDMARKFLLLFSDSNVAPETVVQDFLPGCGANGMGRQNELDDVIYNRNNFVITGHSIGQPQVTVQFGGQCTLFSDRFRPADACALVSAQWSDTRLSSGEQNTVTGTDQVTAIYNGTRWGLCDSDFLGSVTTLTGVTMPGSWFKR